jgi:sulfatase maturation enzyme AslB (radical SAM superfamily)
MKIDEWSIQKRWNPFNSYKLLAQVYRWRLIERGKKIPQPALITLDPINACDLNCVWCNSNYVLKKYHKKMTKETLFGIADFLKDWQGTKKWEKGVEGVCIAGGGEPLLHKDIGEFINRCVKNKIEVGVVTNGTHIDDFIEPLSKCNWVGVSIDAGTPENYERLKGKNKFHKVISNILNLTEYSKINKTTLNTTGQGYGVSYKYLLYPKNCHEVYQAARIAKMIGCRNFHLRPAGIPWNKVGKDKYVFNEWNLGNYEKQIKEARTLEDKTFGVFGITHKFDDDLRTANQFKSCYAIFMSCVFMPPTKDKDKFNLGLCCDRRGDKNLTLEDVTTKDVKKFWGSEEHWKRHDKIKIETCPRCTYQPHNQIMEYVIKKDNMTYKFI